MAKIPPVPGRSEVRRAKGHSAFDMNAGAHMINCTHLVSVGRRTRDGEVEAAGKDGLASLHIPLAFCCIAQIFSLHIAHFQGGDGGREAEQDRCRYGR